MLNLKRVLIMISLSVVLGYLCGFMVYKIYESDVTNIIDSNKVYLLQTGAYSSLDSMKNNTNTLNYVYYNDEGLYKTIIALTKNKDNIEKIKKVYGNDLVINEYYLQDDDLNNKIKEYDNEIKDSSSNQEILDIVEKMLLTYKEEKDIKLVKIY